MVQNTIGRIYLDNNPYEEELKEKWKYLVEPTEKTPKESIFHFEDLKDLNFADLASGSGHILNEGFDILFDLYINEGYSRTEAVKNIFRYNLVGLDIDARAKQLATFALLMKACGKDKSFLDAKVMPRVYSMLRPINEVLPNYDAVLPNFLMGGNQKMLEELRQSLKLMNDANTLGSIMKFYLSDATRNTVMVRVQEYEEQLVNGDVVTEDNRLLLPYMSIILALTDKYAAICMNPPYMGSGRFDDTLSNYVKNNYHKSKADLFAIFMDVAIDRLADCGKYGMINMHSWMFLSSFEELRKSILDNNHIDSLLHLGPRTFDELGGEVVQNAAFIITKAQHSLDKGIYFRLIEGKNCNDKEKMFLNAQSSRTEGIYFSNISQNNFDRIPGNVIGYWVSNQLLNAFTNSLMSSLVPVKKGLDTGNNDYFLKYWHEVDFNKIGIRKNKADFCGHYKWAPHDKGGSFCRWYGNNEWIINYENNGEELRNSSANLRSERLYFTNAITWNSLSTGKISFRLSNYGAISNTAGSSLYPSDDEIYSYLSFLNSKVAQYCLDIVSPTLNYSAGPVGLIPIILSNTGIDLAIDNVEICKADWDSHETSWDFVTNPLICLYKKTKEDGSNVLSIKDLVKKFEVNWEKNFYQLQTNEEDLNRKFIDIYSLQDELTPDVSLDEITILQKGEIKIEDNELKWNADVVMKQLISYAVGCMMGRYSIDKPGLILANQGDGLEQFNKQVPDSRFAPDDDGIIPLMSAQSDFADNATIRFKQWLVAAFGEETLVENLNFIEKCLGKSIDDYFVKDFWKDHKKMYQNRPIYWLFSSKKGAFQCLTYMHRMDAYTAERIRTKYLLPHIEWLIQKQGEMEANAANLNARERKELDNIGKQIEECREYHDRLHVIADKQIAFDLDDGVVVNYAKFGDVLAKLK